MPASIAYMTHDPVNAVLARRMARRLGFNLAVLAVKDANHAVGADLMVLDLDHLPPECKSNLFLRVGNGELREGMAVHSYNLTAAEKHALRRVGVSVFRRLTAAVFAVPTVGSTTTDRMQ